MGSRILQRQVLDPGGCIGPYGQSLSVLLISPALHTPASERFSTCRPHQTGSPWRKSLGSQLFLGPHHHLAQGWMELNESVNEPGGRPFSLALSRPVLEDHPHPASRGCSALPTVPRETRTKVALCPLTLAPGLPPCVLPSLPGLNCFRACPHPKGEEAPWSDSCPEPPRCSGECAWDRRLEGLGEVNWW